MTPLELVLISPVAALAGVVIGIMGNAYLEQLRERRAAKRERDQAIAELLTATVDLITGIQALRGAYKQQTRRRHYIRVSAVILAAVGSTMTIGETLSRELLDWRRISPALDRILAVDSELDDNQRRIALDVVTVVGPRTARFHAAVVVLTLVSRHVIERGSGHVIDQALACF